MVIYNKMRGNQKHKGWTEEEDKAITELVNKLGVKSWARVARDMGYHYGLKGKTGKQCRERWYNHLNPGISKDQWSYEEEQIMFQAHKKFGNKWKLIAEKLPGRTDNSIKNHFYSTIRRSLRRIGKLTGSKNSTFQMRKIKPITLSKIFCIAEGRQPEDQDSYGYSPQHINHEKKQEILDELKQNCEQIANILMLFAQQKPNSVLKENTQKQITLYRKVLDKMIEINELYEGERNNLVKIRKQKKLERNFDEASISSEEEPVMDEQEPISSSFLSKQQKITSRGRQRRIKLPTFHPSEAEIFGKIPQLLQNIVKSEEKSQQRNLGTYQNSIDSEKFISKPVEGKPSQQKIEEEYEFSIQFSHGQNNNLFGEEASPGFLPPLMALTPTGLQVLSRQSTHNLQPIKNEQCNDFVQKLKEQVQKKNLQTQRKKEQLERNLYPSPSSAFRLYN